VQHVSLNSVRFERFLEVRQGLARRLEMGSSDNQLLGPDGMGPAGKQCGDQEDACIEDCERREE
jgi:hypothetical protein